MEKTPVIAAIDIGTNSFHMVIAKINRSGAMNIISREKEMVRLGSSGKDMKYLQEDAMERGVRVLYSFAKMAESHDAIIRAVATSAVREAVNKEAFIRRVRNELAIEIEVISGVEEGRLIYLGAIHALPTYDKKILIIDIGGGSTETIVGLKEEIEFVHSEKIGSIRLTKLFFDSGNYNKEAVSDAKRYIKGEWATVLNQIKSSGFETTNGASGTIQSLAYMALASKQQLIPELLNGYSVPASDILDVIKKIIRCKNISEIQKLPGVDPKRADILIGGSIILEIILEELNIKEILLSPYALREGIVYDTYEKQVTSKAHNHIANLRYETIKNLALRYGIFDEHSQFVTQIALKFFDNLAKFHKLGKYEREILELSAIVHDIGYWISHDQHHKHSYYIITHSDLPGFTNDESEIIALIARYHRKSHPKKKHSEFAKFEEKTQYCIKVLSGILRIAEGIDRRQKQYVQDIIFPNLEEVIKNYKKSDSAFQGKIEINIVPKKTKKSIDIEIWGANRRKELLEHVLGIEIELD
jgi:exopolyphosphatase/guanosine-5'-triphosphate,3'-diphosphate pyrophosphatase